MSQTEANGSLESDIVPPDRSSSSSAPPALQLATESLFAFRVEYAKIFSDIRAHEDYFSFYESNKEKGRPLPPPLDPNPFLFDNVAYEDDDSFSRKYDRQFANTPQDSFENLHQAAQQFHQMNLNQSKNVDIWNPAPQRLRKGPFNNSFSDLNYSSSPSAQTALNTANFIWKDEDLNPNNYAQEPIKPDPRMMDREPLQPFYGNADPQLDAFEKERIQQQQQEDNQNGVDPTSPRSNVICRYYSSGYCSRGDKCFYSHDGQVQEQTSPTPKEPKNSRQNAKQPKSTPRKNAPAQSPAPVTPQRDNHLSVDHGRGSHARTPSRESNNLSNAKGDQSNGHSINDNMDHPGAPTSPRNGQEVNYNFETLVGRIYMVSKDQQGCRFLQKKLEEQEPKAVEQIFNEVFDYITELMTDPFGNYLCQKLLEHCNDHQRYLIVKKVAPDLVFISKNMHGTRAVQKMIECLSSPAQVDLIKHALGNSVVELIQDLNGNHVIQRCLNRLSPDDNQFIYDAVTSGRNCVEVATHRHGCCVLQRCIDHASNRQKVQLIQEITKNALILVQDPYGNYVVQYCLDLPFPDLIDNLAKAFYGNLRILATQKFSSNVVEKCLGVAGPSARHLIIKEIISEKANFLMLLQDPFANYVIQTALAVSDPQQHVELVEAIRPFLNQLRNTPYGKRIQSKIAKETAERAKR